MKTTMPAASVSCEDGDMAGMLQSHLMMTPGLR
jgi:hypothetical protein